MLTTIQVIIAVILMVLVLIQERSSGMSGLFGGSGDGGAYQQRRGIEKTVFTATIVMTVLFAGISIVNLLY